MFSRDMALTINSSFEKKNFVFPGTFHAIDTIDWVYSLNIMEIDQCLKSDNWRRPWPTR